MSNNNVTSPCASTTWRLRLQCVALLGLYSATTLADCPVWPPEPVDVDVAVPGAELAAARAAWTANSCEQTMAARQDLFNRLSRACGTTVPMPPEIDAHPVELPPELAALNADYQSRLRACVAAAEAEARAAPLKPSGE